MVEAPKPATFATKLLDSSLKTSTLSGLMFPWMMSVPRLVFFYLDGNARHILCICKCRIAFATSAHSFNLTSPAVVFPSPEADHSVKFPKLAFSNTSTGQSSLLSGEESQHKPSSLMMFGCPRTSGCPNTEISEYTRWKSFDWSASDRVSQCRSNRLKAKLVCASINDWRIFAVASSLTVSSAGCQVMGRKLMFNFWARDMNSKCGFSSALRVDESLLETRMDSHVVSIPSRVSSLIFKSSGRTW